ncbi:MAG: hypothetical protein HY360_06255 [Verrucomicrobia bacterium]|nr:hypothetical protein [Verrucomicrobiota bacterium]
MNSTLRADLERLKQLAYHRVEWSGDLLRQIHRLPRKCRTHPAYGVLQVLRHWLFAPITLWPVDVDGLGRWVVDAIRAGRRLERPLVLLTELLGEPPENAAQEIVAQHEHQVAKGDYESLLMARHKYEFQEQDLLANPEFVAEWNRLKEIVDVRRHQDHKKIIRRRMVQERNFRPDFGFRWKKPAERFQEIFDAFCHRWNLYGMQGDRPLLLRLTVNLTPFGTMIFIPAYWSLDPKRDFKWRTITALHRARGVPRQGAKLGLNRLSRAEEARKAQALWNQATQAGLKGDQKFQWVMGGLGWHPRTDESKLKRLLRQP